MKNGWQIRKLGDVCDFDKTQGFYKHLPYVGLENIESNMARFVGSSDPQQVKSSTFRFSDKHVLYGRLRPYLNKVLAPDFEGHCSTEIFPIKPRSGLSREYLLYWFLAKETVDRINATCTGARMPRADMHEVLEFDFPLPPLLEQKRIVGIIDEAFEGIAIAKANAEKNLQNARALFDVQLQSVFSQPGKEWKKKSLEELGTITSSKRIFKSEYVKSGVPFFRTKEVKELANGIDISTELFISDARYDEIKSSFGVPKPGDILLTAIGTIGEIYVVHGDQKFYFKDGNVLWLKDFKTINPHFLKYVLISFVEGLNKMAHGAAYSALTIQRLNIHAIFVPSPAEQAAIVSQLDYLREETQNLESIYRQKLIALEELKRTLLHQAFTGKL
jgi:type I restriction enzyme, S subunit